MSNLELTKTTMRQGVWEGAITNAGDEKPAISVTYLGKNVPEVELVEGSGEIDWVLRIPIPQDAIADGVQTILINDADSQEKLGQITLIAGEALGGDLRAEVDLLRAELDMLKRAFRRHCLETT